jgi:hypothetical protein
MRNAAAFSFYGAPDERAYALLERRLRESPDSAFTSTADTVLGMFAELAARVDADVNAVKRRLFAPSLASADDNKAAGRWISAQHRRLARIARRMAEAFARLSGVNDHTFHLLAPALHYMGESVKGHIKETLFHGALHALMRLALSSGRHHEEIQLDVGRRLVTCTLTSLYFRALLLARLAGGGLTFAQIEILDSWLWIRMPALAGADTAPEGAVWRADLDSNEGLRRGVRKDTGPSLYLAQAPLEAMRLAISKEFHLGRTVVASGDVSTFAIEDHFAALDALRRLLRGIRHESAGRGGRGKSNDVVELHVGLTEVMAKALAVTRQSIALLPMIETGTRTARIERERDHATGEVREPVRRIVQLIDVSDSGVGLEGQETDCSGIAVGDLVALRLVSEGPLLLAKVVRRLPAATGGRVVFGLFRLTSAAQPVHARQPSAGTAARELTLLYIPGDDDSGRHDSYLTSELGASERELFETTVGDDIFTFRFNRVRESGRGWVMAGFEVTAARRRTLQLAERGRDSAFEPGLRPDAASAELHLQPLKDRALQPDGTTDYFGER